VNTSGTRLGKVWTPGRSESDECVIHPWRLIL
jgi:hypothetical protein